MAALSVVLAISAAVPARAAADPAASRVETFCNGVIATLRDQKARDPKTRAAQMRPLIEANFELSVMAQFAVGPRWATMTPVEHAAIVAGLLRYTSARYAQEFDSYTGQRCVVDPAIISRGSDKLVKTQITEPDGTSSVNYRLREYGGAAKVVDVYFNGVSQLATQRADFAAVLQTGGAPGLVAKLNDLTARIQAGSR